MPGAVAAETMKILQSIETGGPGGAERVLIALCRGLRERGHEVEALLLKQGWLADRLHEAGVPVRQLDLRGGIDRPFVVGHSDGATIGFEHAMLGHHQDILVAIASPLNLSKIRLYFNSAIFIQVSFF